MGIPYDYPLQGDSEAACVDILTNDPDLQAAFPTVRVATDLVGYTDGLQWVEVARKGGNTVSFVMDKPRIDFYIYGDTRANAYDISALVQRALLNSQTNYVGKGVRIQTVKVETGITRVPDRLNESSRYVLSLRLTVTPE